VAGLGDFDADYQTDLLLYDSANRVLAFASINVDDQTDTGMTETASTKKGRRNGKATDSEIVTSDLNRITILNEGEQVIGIGNFNNDYSDDVLIRDADGNYRFITINCGVVTTEDENLTDLPAGEVVGAGDFNEDKIDDLVFYDAEQELYTIRFDSEGVVSTYAIPGYFLGGEDYSLFAIDDVNGDDIDDLIWHNSETGEVFITTFADGEASLFGQPAFKGEPWKRGWTLVDAADYNLDGRTDYLWAPTNGNASSGKSTLYVAYMDGFLPAKSKNSGSGVISLNFDPGNNFIK
jgi:hypothetical protein